MQNPFNDQCDELVYSTFNRIDSNQYANKEACVNDLLSTNKIYTNLPLTYQQQVADRLWTHYERPYIRKILNAINPQYFQIQQSSGNHSSPYKAINTEGLLSRVFDELPYQNRATTQENLMGKEVIEAFLNDFLLFGREFAQAKLLNPLLSELIDFEKSDFRGPFVAKHLGTDIYKNFEKANLVNGFASACKVLVDSIITDFYKKNLALAEIYAASAAIGASARQQAGAQNNSKLYDEKKKYLFCQAMSNDIFEFASSYQDSLLDEQNIQNSINLIKERSEIFNKFLENKENSQKLFAQLSFDFLLKDLNELNKHSEKNAQRIEKIRSIIQKYDYEHQMNIQARARVNLRRGLSVFFTLLFAGAAIAIGLFTFGAGAAAILPIVPNLALFATSAALAGIGFFSSLYHAWKSRSISQSINRFDSVSKMPQSVTSPANTCDKLNKALTQAPNMVASNLREFDSGPSSTVSSGSSIASPPSDASLSEAPTIVQPEHDDTSSTEESSPSPISRAKHP